MLATSASVLSRRAGAAACPTLRLLSSSPQSSQFSQRRLPLRARQPAFPPSRQLRRSSSSSPSSATAANMAPALRLPNSVVFVCDIQDKFRKAIYEFDKVVSTSRKVLRAAAILDIPVVVTTQNRARLGDTVPELSTLYAPPGSASTKAKLLVNADKTLFSMWTPEVKAVFSPAASPDPSSVVIVGIESHICVTQTALDLLAAGHRVYVLADGVSSSNREEVPIALARLRTAGATVTTSESWMYEAVGDASSPAFRDIIALVKDTGVDTTAALSSLLSSKI